MGLLEIVQRFDRLSKIKERGQNITGNSIPSKQTYSNCDFSNNLLDDWLPESFE